ncbi:SAM-dependent methyltransferase [Estrella lausannensis]|uniref:Methyltransferase domain-containing protein n=1 Tax=Estrella lausannensis TaxID=483423 RepID=A0A0H5E5Y4_9BACT|nr:methyltransferase domain-containing protein [Estrella lausannensis]CRX38645.1 Conserved hypothetical protein [Estrella lausannensis]
MSKPLKVGSLIENTLAPDRLGSLLGLVALKIKTRLIGIKEFFKTAFLYYGNTKFMKSDLSLMGMYLFNSPYSISKRFLEEQGDKNIYAYGETPLDTMEKIVRECGISSADHVFELGSGRGRVCFWLNTVLGAKVTGIDNVPAFIERAEKIRHKLGMEGVHFVLGDFLTAPLNGGTVYYLFGSALEEEFLGKMAKRFEELPKGTRFVTISFPLTDYTKPGSFEVMKRFPVTFPWGETDAYLQIKKK